MIHVISKEKAVERRTDVERNLMGQDYVFVGPEKPLDGQWSLTRTHVSLIKKMVCEGLDYIIVAEDDLLPSADFESYRDRIKEADDMKADVLLLGVCFARGHSRLTDTMYQARDFDGTQLVVYFNRIKGKLQRIEGNRNYCISHVLMSSFLNVKIAFPFCAYQKRYDDSMCTSDQNYRFREEDFIKYSIG